MASRNESFFHLHLVSDATGETLTTVARAATAQYTNVSPVEHVYPLVRTQKQLERVLSEIEESPGIVLYTLIEDDLVDDMCLSLAPRFAGPQPQYLTLLRARAQESWPRSSVGLRSWSRN